MMKLNNDGTIATESFLRFKGDMYDSMMQFTRGCDYPVLDVVSQWYVKVVNNQGLSQVADLRNTSMWEERRFADVVIKGTRPLDREKHQVEIINSAELDNGNTIMVCEELDEDSGQLLICQHVPHTPTVSGFWVDNIDDLVDVKILAKHSYKMLNKASKSLT